MCEIIRIVLYCSNHVLALCLQEYGKPSYLNALTTALTTLYFYSNKPNAVTFVH